MSWAYCGTDQPQYVSLLNEPEVIPKKLINSESFIQELSNNNNRVHTFISTHFSKIVIELTEHSLIMPGNINRIDPDTIRKLAYQSACFLHIVIFKKNLNDNEVSILYDNVIRYFENKGEFLQQTIYPANFCNLFSAFFQRYGNQLLNIGKNIEYLVDNLLSQTHREIMGQCLENLILVQRVQQCNIQVLAKYKILQKIMNIISIQSPSVENSHDLKVQFKCENLIDILIGCALKANGVLDGNVLLQFIMDKQRFSKLVNSLINCKKLQSKFLELIKAFTFIQKINLQEIQQMLLNELNKMSQQPKTYHAHILEILLHALNQENQKNRETANRILTTKNILNNLLQFLWKYPNCNILHNRIEKIIYTLFYKKNIVLIDYLFQECNIIAKTIDQSKYFKEQAHFGYLVKIIKTYTTLRINNQISDAAVERNQRKWSQFTQNILQPYVNFSNVKLGEMEGVSDPSPLEHSVTMMHDNKKLNSSIKSNTSISFNNVAQHAQIATIMPKISTQSTVDEKPIQLIAINPKTNTSQIGAINNNLRAVPLGISLQTNIGNKPIKITFGTNAQSQIKIEQTQKNSQKGQNFEDFLKKRMSEQQLNFSKTNRSKSRTPGKMKGNENKKNRWKANQEENQPEVTLSPLPNSSKKQEISSKAQQKLNMKPIRLIKIENKKLNQTQQCRSINADRDSRLIQWLKAMPR